MRSSSFVSSLVGFTHIPSRSGPGPGPDRQTSAGMGNVGDVGLGYALAMDGGGDLHDDGTEEPKRAVSKRYVLHESF